TFRRATTRIATTWTASSRSGIWERTITRISRRRSRFVSAIGAPNGGVYAVVEQRVQVSPTRFRIQDICVVLGGRPKEQIFTTPPFICIEILSPEDRLSRVQERMNDYLHFGVPYMWLLDPETQKAYRWTAEGMHEVSELRTEQPEIVIPLAELFEAP